MNPPSGYDPTVSTLPDPGATAVPMKAMMGGGTIKQTSTVTILGEPYRIRSTVTFPLEDEDERLLEAFQVGPDVQRILGQDAILGFFHALVTYNCEKEEGVLLNPKCEPVRAVLRAALMKGFLEDIDGEREKRNMGPLANILSEDMLKRRNKVDVIEHLSELLPSGKSALNSILLSIDDTLLKERYHLQEDPTVPEIDTPLDNLLSPLANS